MTVTDCVGREIKPGCTILYPVRRRSEMKLKRMKVQNEAALNLNGRCVSGFNADGRPVYVYNLENVIVVVPLGVQYE